MKMFARSITALALAGMLGHAAHAQGFPDRPVRVVVPFAAGNTLDTALRQLSEEFKKNTNQTILIDNRPGGAGIIAAQNIMQSRPDGYSLLLSNTSMFGINPHSFSKLPYDVDKSFRHVGALLGTSQVLAVNSTVPSNNLKDFIAWVKSQPAGAVSYASFTAGNSSHFAGVILNQRAGMQLTHVPFNGTPPAVQNLVGGQVNAAFLPLLAVKPHVDAGRVRLLAVTSGQRTPLAPAMPSFKEEGFPDMEIYTWSGFSAPAGTPDEAVNRLNAEFNKGLQSNEIKTKWQAVDFIPMVFTPAEFAAFIRKDSERWAEAVRISGFKASE